MKIVIERTSVRTRITSKRPRVWIGCTETGRKLYVLVAGIYIPDADPRAFRELKHQPRKERRWGTALLRLANRADREYARKHRLRQHPVDEEQLT